jgi:NAD-specific glutamate dehydrogenase
MLMDLFEARFDSQGSYKDKVLDISLQLSSYLDTVESSTEEKVLHNMRLIIEAIVRTNF